MDAASDDLWYYIHPAHQEPIGPIAGEQLRAMAAENKISKRTLVWTEGMDNWQELGSLAQLQRTEKVNPSPKFLKKK